MLTQIRVDVLLLLHKSPELSPGHCQGVGCLPVLLLTVGTSRGQTVLTLPPAHRGCCTGVADPDPYVFGPPGSGSGFISRRYGSGSSYHQAKLVRKRLIPTVLRLLFEFLSLKNVVNVPLLVISRKTFNTYGSDGSGSATLPKTQGIGSLNAAKSPYFRCHLHTYTWCCASSGPGYKRLK
jgi:hypothetical protein